MHVVEIVARIGDTTLAVTELGPGGDYWIGTAADVDLAIEVPGLRSFPVVGTRGDRFVVRRPAGIVATRNGVALEPTEAVLAPGDRVTMSIGAIALSITAGAPAARLPRSGFDHRPGVYAAGSLGVHLAVWLLATVFAEPEPVAVPVAPATREVVTLDSPLVANLEPRLTDNRPVRSQRREPAAAKPRAARAPEPVVATAEPEAANEPVTKERAVARARRAGMLGGIRPEDIRAITGTADLNKALSEVGPIYDEDAAASKRFGGGRRFDPTKDPRFDSVATGRYATVATGKGAGEYYDLGTTKRRAPRVELCARGSCVAVGGADKAMITNEIGKQVASITACYDRANNAALRGDVVVTFEIGEDGRVKRARGRGLGAVGTCVANVVGGIEFAWGRVTKVTYPVAFQPS